MGSDHLVYVGRYLLDHTVHGWNEPCQSLIFTTSHWSALTLGYKQVLLCTNTLSSLPTGEQWSLLLCSVIYGESWWQRNLPAVKIQWLRGGGGFSHPHQVCGWGNWFIFFRSTSWLIERKRIMYGLALFEFGKYCGEPHKNLWGTNLSLNPGHL